MKRTGCLRCMGCTGPAEAELDTALNGDMLVSLSVSRLAVSRLPQETNTEPAVKFSALLVHWVQNYSNMTKNYLFFVLLFGRDLATPGHLASIVISSCRVGSFVAVCYLCICFLKYFN